MALPLSPRTADDTQSPTEYSLPRRSAPAASRVVMDMIDHIPTLNLRGGNAPEGRAQERGDVGGDPQSSAAAALRATTATAGAFPGKSLALSRVFLINDVERQADVRDFLILQRDFGFHRLGMKRSVPRQSLLRVRHGRHSKIWPPSAVSM